jgi:hypothetical protein
MPDRLYPRLRVTSNPECGWRVYGIQTPDSAPDLIACTDDWREAVVWADQFAALLAVLFTRTILGYSPFPDDVA